MNVVSIAVVARSLDHLLLRGVGVTVGMVLNPSTVSLKFQSFYSQAEVDHIYSAGNDGLIFGITLGYLINAVICIWLSTQNMDENMKIQYVSFTFLLTSVLQISAAAGLRIIRASSDSSALATLKIPSIGTGVSGETIGGSSSLDGGTLGVGSSLLGGSWLGQSMSQQLMDKVPLALAVVNVTASLTPGLLSLYNSLMDAKPVVDLPTPPLNFEAGERAHISEFSTPGFTDITPSEELAIPDSSLSLQDFSPSALPAVEPVNSSDSRPPKQTPESNAPGVSPSESSPSHSPLRLLKAREIVAPPSLLGEYQYGQLFSTFIASYSYVNVIPSWANEMTAGVRVNEAVWLSSGFACIVYYIFGFLLAFAYPTVHTDNILQEVLADNSTGVVTKFFIYIFNLLTVLPGILVYSITTRYNLLNSGAASAKGSFLIGCVCPFLFAWLLANDDYFAAVLQWSSLLFSLAVNFVIPAVVYVTACSAQRLATRNPTRHFHTMKRYASRTKDGVRHLVDDISAQLRDYLRSLPSGELDPHVAALLNQPSPSGFSPRASFDFAGSPLSSRNFRGPSSPKKDSILTDITSWQATPAEIKSSRPVNVNSIASISHIPEVVSEGSVVTVSLPSDSSKEKGVRRNSTPVAYNREAMPRKRRASVAYLDPCSINSNRNERRIRTKSEGGQDLNDLHDLFATSSLFTNDPLSPRFSHTQPTIPDSQDSPTHSPRYSPNDSPIPSQMMNPTMSQMSTPLTPSRVDQSPNSKSPNSNHTSHHSSPPISPPVDTMEPSISISPQINSTSPAFRQSNMMQEHIETPPSLLSPFSRSSNSPASDFSRNPHGMHAFDVHPLGIRAQTCIDMQDARASDLDESNGGFRWAECRSTIALTPAASVAVEARRCNTTPGGRRTVGRYKQVRFDGDVTPRSPHPEMNLTKLSSKVMELLQDSDSEEAKKQTTKSGWMTSISSTLSRSFHSFSLDPSASHTHQEDASARSPIFRQASLASPPARQMDELITSLQRGQSFSPATRRKGEWLLGDRMTKRGRTLVIPGTKEAPAITITPTDNTPVLGPADISTNPLMRLMSSELGQSRTSPPLTRTETLDTFHGSVAGRQTDPHSSRGSSEVINFCESVASEDAASSRQSWDSNMMEFHPMRSVELQERMKDARKDFPRHNTTGQQLPSLWRNTDHHHAAGHSPLWMSATPRTPSLSLVMDPLHEEQSVALSPRRKPGRTGRTFLAPPTVGLCDLPVEPPLDLMVDPVAGAEDAYECDEVASTRDLKPMRIHVFPEGPLRTHHLLATRILMGILVAFCVLSASSQLVVDLLQAMGKLPPASVETVLDSSWFVQFVASFWPGVETVVTMG